jgi:methyltransferase (TIGR00027 family)
MQPGQASRTLVRPAVRRAAHQLLDVPRIFDDPIAVGLLPETGEAAVLAAHDEHASQDAKLMRSLFAFRSRFAEDRLAQAAARGAQQYVIVGAGLDTFPWRQPNYARTLRIFAADHVATLAWTQVRFWERGLPKPPNLSFVPVDLEERRLSDALVAAGFAPNVPTFVSVLGVLQYLTDAATDALWDFAAALPSGSEIVASFVLPDEELTGDDLVIARRGIDIGAATGEPWLSHNTPEKLTTHLSQLGFATVEHLTPAAAQERYFAGRTDGLRAPVWEQLIAAVV